MTYLTPHDWQAARIKQIVEEPTHAALVAAGTGAGKTLIGVEATRGLGAKRVLVIAPLNTHAAWNTRYIEQGVADTTYIIDATKVGLDNASRLFAGEQGVYIVGREFFYLSATNSRPKNDKSKGRVARWSWAKAKFDLVILDESHSAQNRDALMSTTLRSLKTKFKICMSATPAGNSFMGIWNPCRWLWPDHIDRSQWRWADKWGVIEQNPHSSSGRGKKVVGEKVPGAFVKSLPCYIYYEAPRGKVVTRKVSIELSPRQREIYDQMERDALAWLGDHPMVAQLPVTQKMRMRQIALGEPMIREDGTVDFAVDCASSKADACRVIADKHHPGDQLLILTSSQKFAAVLAQRLPCAVEWTGAVTQKERAKRKQAFLDYRVRYLVATIDAVGTGTDGLQDVCHVEIWLDESFNNVNNEQALGRLDRQGQTETVYRYRLIAPKTDDTKYLNSLAERRHDMRQTLKGA